MSKHERCAARAQSPDYAEALRDEALEKQREAREGR